jgi:hypothetical protein
MTIRGSLNFFLLETCKGIPTPHSSRKPRRRGRLLYWLLLILPKLLALIVWTLQIR